ncbi:O-sialoglycoprotein endopeptidase [Streptococcus agalactiae LMG 14747]|uniref:O-sialoglycoprotein endopeptidase n=1 Tax=Streptococcus agalactiae LMG 14747 TaxID=1154860 RepID=V6Z2I4_STRAG|nr:O-sialoglycoprotein endopeptidase [Streptococcus agalactiae LMG 14747]
MKLKKWVSLGALVAMSVLFLAACSRKSADDDKVVVKVGTMAKSDSEEARWNKVEELLKDENVTIKYTEFTDYLQPNKALENREIDINAFQHYNFLNEWNKKNNTDLVGIAETYITAFRLYSGTESGKNKYTDVKELPDKATIVIPNDTVNESRALYLLQSAGLIELGVSGDTFAALDDITKNEKDLDIVEVDAAQTARQLQSADAAVINNDFVVEAGIYPSKAIFIEPKGDNAKQWYNLIAAKKDWKKAKNADAIQKVVDAYHTDEVKKVIKESSEGLDEPVW